MLESDYQGFLAAGGDLKKAKFHNNVSGEHLLDIPIENVRKIDVAFAYVSAPVHKVCIPGLHLTLGIYNRLWSLLEDACAELDLRLAASGDSGEGGLSYSLYSSRLKQRSELQSQLQTQLGYASVAEQLATYLSMSLPNPESNQTLQGLLKEAAAARKKADEMVKVVSKADKLHTASFITIVRRTIQLRSHNKEEIFP